MQNGFDNEGTTLSLFFFLNSFNTSKAKLLSILETQPLNYHGKYVTLACDSKSAHIGALMLESEYDMEEVKRKSTPSPASGKESRLGVENKTGLSICSELPLLGLLLGLDRPSRIDSGSIPIIYIESGQSHVLTPPVHQSRVQ